MKLRKLALSVVVLSLLSIPAFAKNMKPGKWEITVQMEVPGVSMKIPPVTVTQCVTKEQADSAEATMPNDKKNSDCKISDIKEDGNTVSYKMTCEKSKITGEGTTTYAGDSFTGTMKINMGGQDMSQQLSGKLLGECDK